MSHRRSWIALITALGALSCATPRAAEFPTLANDAWYRVEVVIFERLGDAASPQEILVTRAPRAFPRDVLAFDDDASRAAGYVLDAESRELTPMPVTASPAAVAPARTPAQPPVLPTAADRAAAAIADYEAQLQQRSYRFEPQSSLLLSAQTGRLRGGGYRVVFHHAWIQPVPDRDQLLPMLIQAGDRVGTGWRIEGTLGVTRGHYLHLDTRLWYTPDPSAAPVASAQPVAQRTNGDAIGSRTSEKNSESGPEYMQLYEQRRMRSGELHYLDHPKFGVLARVDPVLPPDALVAELARLGAAPPPASGSPER
jgi:hypothetical protein